MYRKMYLQLFIIVFIFDLFYYFIFTILSSKKSAINTKKLWFPLFMLALIHVGPMLQSNFIEFSIIIQIKNNKTLLFIKQTRVEEETIYFHGFQKIKHQLFINNIHIISHK